MTHSLTRLLTKSASGVLAALRGSTYGRKYDSPLRLLRPCWTAFLNSLRESLKESVTSGLSWFRCAQVVWQQSVTEQTPCRSMSGPPLSKSQNSRTSQPVLLDSQYTLIESGNGVIRKDTAGQPVIEGLVLIQFTWYWKLPSPSTEICTFVTGSPCAIRARNSFDNSGSMVRVRI